MVARHKGKIIYLEDGEAVEHGAKKDNGIFTCGSFQNKAE